MATVPTTTSSQLRKKSAPKKLSRPRSWSAWLGFPSSRLEGFLGRVTDVLVGAATVRWRALVTVVPSTSVASGVPRSTTISTAKLVFKTVFQTGLFGYPI